jgi:ATP-dependent Lon protease
MLTLDLEKEHRLLAANSQIEALRLMHEYLNHELQVVELRQKIQSQAASEMSREQREYLLRQQLRAIQQELGERSPEQADIEELRERLEALEISDQVRKEAERELARLERLPSASPEYQVTRTYLEFVTELPWSKTTEDKLDLLRAREVLDEDHYNLKEVKDRIIEHLAVLKLNPNAKAPILCFVGPPGVGKTSLGKSIARAIGREFSRMSLGGLHDEAELRGHRRTYVGAMPGRIIQAVRRAGVRNPLLMLDEVDKLGRDFRGDPAAALLEILDPAQNHEFRDNYLDLPFDLSKVFFVTTANALDTIPQALLDRMEILRLAGYSDIEKRTIARQFLLPRQRTEAGLSEANLAVPDETVARIIRGYTREAGVRELERMLGTVCRKVATKFATGQTEPVSVRPEDLGDLLGPERFFEEAARKDLPPGVAAGLAWTQAGGEILYVEAVRIPEGKDLTLTGQLGNVMKESAKAARSYVTSKADYLGIDPERLKGGVHIHVPAGATPKDGPSAGITMAVALAALSAELPARSDTAMTGEVTLTGLVLPVGGIKEKILAAHRSGIRRVILPKQNQKDLRDLPEHVVQELEFVFVDRIDEGLVAAIPALAARLAPTARRVAAV